MIIPLMGGVYKGLGIAVSAEPHASVNSDLPRVVFNANWHGKDVMGVAVYLLDILSINPEG